MMAIFCRSAMMAGKVAMKLGITDFNRITGFTRRRPGGST
jgi:hypothetical protein